MTQELTETDRFLNFRPLRRYFEEEAAIFTTSAIHQWKALVCVFHFILTKPQPTGGTCHGPDQLRSVGLWACEARLLTLLHISDEYLNLIRRSTEIWYQNRRTGSEKLRNMLSVSAPYEPRLAFELEWN